MGRKRSLTPEQEQEILKLKRTGIKSVDLARNYKVCSRTVDRVLRSHGFPLRRGRIPHEHYSCIATYLTAHPDTKLPRSLKAISKLTGCGVDSIKMYLYRLRRELRHKAEAIEWTGPGSAYWKYRDSKGRTIPARAISSYRIRVESWTHAVVLDVVLRGGGKTTIRLSADLVRKLYLAVVSTDASRPTSESQDVVGVPPVKL